MTLRSDVELGDDARIDDLAILGEVSGRSRGGEPLRIGARARVRAFSILYAGATIGDDLETGHHVVIREENRIGEGLRIWNNSVIDYGCVVGSRVRIHTGVYVSQGSLLEDDVFLAPGVGIANDRFPVCTMCLDGATLRRGARVGVNATLLPGVEIGEEALVGAGTVVTRDVPAWAIVVGNPARVIGSVRDLECPRGAEDCPGAPGAPARRLLAEGTMR